MTVTFTANNYAVSVKPLDLLKSAATEMNVLAQGEELSGSDQAWMLEKLQRLLDQFNARRECIYNVNFSRFTVPTNTQPITIGPGGTFQMKLRPVKLVNAALILTNSGTELDIPIRVQDDDWWANQTLKGLTSTLFTDVYYSPDNPLGNLYFWPIPTQSNDVRLETWVNLAQAIDLTTPIAMPVGYWDAIVLSLAVQSCPSFGKEAGPTLVALQRQAMSVIFANNSPSPIMVTKGQGIPSKRGEVRPGFNFLTGQPW